MTEPLSRAALMIAQNIQRVRPEMQGWVAASCADDLAHGNPAFDRTAFLVECGLLPKARRDVQS